MRIAAVSAAAALVACGTPDPQTISCERTAASRRDVGGAVIIHFTRAVDVPELAAGGRANRTRLIAALRRDAERSRAGTVELLRRWGIPATPLWMINAVAATVPPALVAELARRPEIDRIVPDRAIRIPAVAAGRAVTGWNLSVIGAPAAWAAGRRGEGVVVAVLDTGVDVDHPDLAERWRAGGWYDPYAQHATPHDGDGHGTQVAGLAVGGDASGRAIGVAPGARWIAARIFDDDGRGSMSAIHRALQWVLDPDGDPATDDAADVAVASWGFGDQVGVCDLELEPDLAALRAAQIAAVFAAGNHGPYPASSISPANNPSAFATGAVDEGLVVIAASSRGPDACTARVYPELVAPGANVHTADRTFGGQFPDAYADVTGTSFAAPHVAGAMALLRGAHPGASVAELEGALVATARDLPPLGVDDASGAGIVDVTAAEAWLAGHSPSCDDRDGDGYPGAPGCGDAVDCDDGDPAIHPGACEIAGDAIDQDCDGTDPAQSSCCAR